MSDIHRGSCFCGAVVIEARGTPLDMGYCHCAYCRAYSGAPVTAYTLWNKEDVRVIKGAEHMRGFNKTGVSDRQYCAKCGGHIFARHPLWDLADIYAGILPTLPFKPTAHVNYESTVFPMQDGLPKYKDFPADAGGSGILLPE